MSYNTAGFVINPSLEVAPSTDGGGEWALRWDDPGSGEIQRRPATQQELLALKLLSADMDLAAAATATGKTRSAIHNLMMAVSNTGVIQAPVSRIVRTDDQIPDAGMLPEDLRVARVFTLQWHITNVCDLRCKHCYDRSNRVALSHKRATAVLEDFAAFCIRCGVRGHVSFSGGNPLLREDFLDLYAQAADLGFETSVLGNPTPEEMLQRIQTIQPLDFFQTSLEGLREHNDLIRGAGHFDRVLAFLDVLRQMGISSSIMLTLTRDNMEQVIRLAELLENKTDHFTFNRLSPVGEGAALQLPEPDAYRAFLSEYVDARSRLSVCGFKDNLINVELDRRGEDTFDGCTGYGCGAAFNFLAVLPDGEVHACRKYPSRIGSVLSESLEDIYFGDAAARYRRRPAGCRSCRLTAICGGCRAITSGCGLDEARAIDPFCNLSNKGET